MPPDPHTASAASRPNPPANTDSRPSRSCRTSAPGVYAVGNLVSVNGGAHPQLAHVGFAEGILAAEHMAALPVAPIDYAGVPRITYSRPEVASVGYTHAAAAAMYGPEAVANDSRRGAYASPSRCGGTTSRWPSDMVPTRIGEKIPSEAAVIVLPGWRGPTGPDAGCRSG